MIIDQAKRTLLRALHIVELDNVIRNNIDPVSGQSRHQPEPDIITGRGQCHKPFLVQNVRVEAVRWIKNTACANQLVEVGGKTPEIFSTGENYKFVIIV